MARSQRRPWRLERNVDSTAGNFYGFEDSGWDKPGEPSCAICGQLILADPNARQFFDSIDDFNEASGNKYHIKLTVPQMHEFLSVGQCDWRSTYRAIVSVQDRPEPFFTGVSYRHSGFGNRGSYCIGAPIGFNDAWLIRGAIHPPGEIAWFGRCAIHPTDQDPENVGWPMHECCYQLLMRAYEEKGIANNIYTLSYALLMEFHTKLQDYYVYGEPPLDSGAHEMIQYDPLFMANYYEAIETAIQRHEEKLPKSLAVNPDYGYQGVKTEGGFYISPGAFSKLPLELAMMILDYCDGSDFRNLILAAKWILPSLYWRRMIPRCLFEAHEDKGGNGLDWKYLGLEVHRKMERKDGLWHRLAITKYMARIWEYCNHPDDGIVSNRFLGVA